VNMSTAPPTRLTAELEFYEIHKLEWLKNNQGEFAVVKGENLLGFFADFHKAYCAGAERYGLNTDFLVKRVVAQEPVFVVF
jgi:hypothetical protein